MNSLMYATWSLVCAGVFGNEEVADEVDGNEADEVKLAGWVGVEISAE
jgi:hypothetical protein